MDAACRQRRDEPGRVPNQEHILGAHAVDPSAHRNQAATAPNDLRLGEVEQVAELLPERAQVGMVRTPACEPDLGDAAYADRPSDVAWRKLRIEEAVQPILIDPTHALQLELDAGQKLAVDAERELARDRGGGAVGADQIARGQAAVRELDAILAAACDSNARPVTIRAPARCASRAYHRSSAGVSVARK